MQQRDFWRMFICFQLIQVFEVLQLYIRFFLDVNWNFLKSEMQKTFTKEENLKFDSNLEMKGFTKE